MKISWAKSALYDLIDITDFMTENNPQAAERFVETIKVKSKILMAHPRIGKIYTATQTDLYSFPIAPYLIFYKLEEQRIIISRILHGARDLEKLIK